MKLLYIDKSRFWGGAEQCLLEILGSLDRSAFAPSVLCDFPLPHQRLFFPTGEVLHRFPSLAWWMGSDRWHKPIRGSDLLTRAVSAKTLRRLLRQKGVDLIHVNLLRDQLRLDLKTAREAGSLVVGHVRSLAIQAPIRSSTLSLCDAVICTSDCVREEVESRAGTAKVFRVYDSIDAAAYEWNMTRADARGNLGLPQNGAILCSAAILDPRKGHDVAIAAISKLIDVFPQCCLVVAGGTMTRPSSRDAELARLQKLAAESPASDRILFLGHCRNMPCLYAASDVVLALSKDGEAFGRVPLEAASASAPVVATKVGATPEIVRDGMTGILVPPNDPGAVVAAVSRLLSSRNMRATLGRRARSWAHRFSCAEHIGQLQEIYTQLASDA